MRRILTSIRSLSSRANIPKRRLGRHAIICSCIDATLVSQATTKNNLPYEFPGWTMRLSNDFLLKPSRCFSTVIPSDSANTNQISILRQTTTRLQDAPVGSMDQQQWSEAYYAILEWLQQTETEGDDKSGIVLESILRSLELLDRLREEESYLQTSENAAESTVPSNFQTDLLNLVLNHWRKSVPSGKLTFKQTARIDLAQTMLLHPERIWERLRACHGSASALQPDVQSFAMIIDTISALVSDSSTNSSIDMNTRTELLTIVDDIIEWLVETAKAREASDNAFPSNETTLRPNVVLFSSAMNAWVKSGLTEAPSRAEELLAQIKSVNVEFPHWEDVAPNKIAYSTVIDAWAKTGNVDRVQSVLQEMHERYHETNDEAMKPSLHAFNGYLVALVKQGRAEEAEALLFQMEDLYEAGELDEAPSVVSYSTVLDGFARSKEDGAALRAESLLRQMIDGRKQGDGLKPNAVSFNSVILAHIRAGSAQAAESLLHEMNDAYANSGDVELRPTLETYGNVLSGLARSRRKDAGERAENLLKYIKDMAASGALEGPPDDVIYNAVLDCWAKSGNKDASFKARAILDEMRHDGVDPDVISYNTVIQCMARSRKFREAELLMNEMENDGVSPNVITYNTLLSAYVAAAPPGGKKQRRLHGKIKDLSDRVEKMFQRMTHDHNVPADIVTHNTLLNFYSKIGDVDRVSSQFEVMLSGDSSVRPDTTSINTVINAWANSGRSEATERAELIFDTHFLQEGSRMSPNSISFNSVMKAWTKGRSPEAAERCQHYFDIMESDFGAELRPDFVTFNILIHAWSLSEDEKAPEYAEQALNEMNRRYDEGELRMQPNNVTYGALINVWSKCRRPEAGEKAENYLRKIIENAKVGTERDLPRVFEFACAVRAWEKSGDVQAPFKADVILHLLLQQVKAGNDKAQPNAHFFGVFLSCLANSRVKDKVLYANRTIQMMKDFNIRPNRHLLGLIHKCYGQQKQKEKEAAAFESSQAIH